MKKDFRLLTEIGKLLYKEKNKPVKIIENDFKNNLFPLSILNSQAPGNGIEKVGLLNKKTYDYLNSISLKNLKSFTLETITTGSNPNTHKNLFNYISKEQKVDTTSVPIKAPTLTKAAVATEVKVKTRNDVIYQYLKTFSIFNKRKNGILIKYNKHISYNFNRFNDKLNLRGVGAEPQTNTFLKPNKNITKRLPLGKELKINKVNTSFKDPLN